MWASAALLTALAMPWSTAAAATLLNRPAPKFSRPDLHDTRIDLAQYRGKVVLLNFWATWCAPCRIEMPRFGQWQRQYGPEGLQVLGISMDDSSGAVRTVVQQMRLPYPIMMGDAKLGELYGGVLGLPVTFLIDRDGIVRQRFDGGAHLPAIEKTIRTLLAAPAR